MIRDRKAQSMVWGFLAMLIFIVVSSGLVDIYRLYAARNWAYSVAQEAAMAGASRGRDWSSILGGGDMRLNAVVAKDEAQKLVVAEMSARGILAIRFGCACLARSNRREHCWIPSPSGSSGGWNGELEFK